MRSLYSRSAIAHIVIAADGSISAISDVAGRISLWKLPWAVPVGRLRPRLTTVVATAFSSTGDYLLSGHQNGEVALWDTVARQTKRRWQASQSPIASLAFTDNDRLAVVASAEGTLTVWRLLYGEIRGLQMQTAPVSSMALSQDGNSAIVVTAGRQKALGILELDWEVSFGKRYETRPTKTTPQNPHISSGAIERPRASKHIRDWVCGTAWLTFWYQPTAMTRPMRAFLLVTRLLLAWCVVGGVPAFFSAFYYRDFSGSMYLLFSVVVFLIVGFVGLREQPRVRLREQPRVRLREGSEVRLHAREILAWYGLAGIILSAFGLLLGRGSIWSLVLATIFCWIGFRARGERIG